MMYVCYLLFKAMLLQMRRIIWNSIFPSQMIKISRTDDDLVYQLLYLIKLKPTVPLYCTVQSTFLSIDTYDLVDFGEGVIG